MQPLGSVTEVGNRFVRACEEAAPLLLEHAAEHDREGTFPVEGLEMLKASGMTAATVPEAQGGWGMESLHDLSVGLSRLAAGDASLAIAINMHLAASWTVAMVSANDKVKGKSTEGPDALLAFIGAGAIAMVNATEPGTDNRHPFTEITKVEEGGDGPAGWSLSGTKIFSTLSPVADVFLVSARATFPEGGPDSWQAGFALVFAGNEGMTVHDDWDALGMRASGSGSITYEGVHLAPEQFLAGGAWGEWSSSGLLSLLSGNVGLVAVFLGIAEQAHRLALEKATRVARRAKGTGHHDDPSVRRAIAEMEVGLATARALVARSTLDLDDLVRGQVLADIPIERVHQVHAHFQACKLVVQRTAIEVVDTAMTVAGGSSYLTSSPLSRLYRDVRAGPFMQPFSPIEAWDYIGSVALGQEGDEAR
jgi:alkylation response protein AidB-like acyl-CoA dehydrogenase